MFADSPSFRVLVYKMGITAITTSERCCEVDRQPGHPGAQERGCALTSMDVHWAPTGLLATMVSPCFRDTSDPLSGTCASLPLLKHDVVKRQATIPQTSLASHFSLSTVGRPTSAERSTDLNM